MSRMVVFGLDNISLGETTGICDLSVQIDGSNSTAGGGSTTIALTDKAQSNSWMQLGRMGLIKPHPKLSWSYAGMFDTPWECYPTAQATVYNAAYLMNCRAPDAPGQLTGSVFDIAGQLISQANAQEEMYIRLGKTEGNAPTVTFPMDQRKFWPQLVDLCKNSGFEIITRPVREDGRLIIYLDIVQYAGIDTDYLLHDGFRANMKVMSVTIDRAIVNRLVGIGTQSTQASRLSTAPLVDEDSKNTYRMRGDVFQVNAPDQGTLEVATAAQLAWSSVPWIIAKVQAEDIGETFYHLDFGNRLRIRITKARLPGGLRGWEGVMRIMALNFLGRSKTIEMTLEAPYVA